MKRNLTVEIVEDCFPETDYEVFVYDERKTKYSTRGLNRLFECTVDSDGAALRFVGITDGTTRTSSASCR